MANKKKKQNTHASGSGSIISNYFESQDKLYERDMQGQKIASETRAKADSYYGEDKKYSDTDYTNQSESRYRRLAEKAVEIKERTQKNSEKYKRTNTLIRNAAKAENNMLSEIPRREQREKQEQQRRKQRELEEKKEKELEKRKNQKFYTSTGNKYKDPSLMGYDELQRTLANVKENKDLFKSRIADSGLFKRGFSGEWEKVQPKDFEEKLGKKGVSWEDYKEYTSLWNKYQDNVEYMKELESNQPRVELEHEYDKLGDTDKQLVKKAADYVWVEKRKYSADKNHLVPTIQDKLEVSSNPDYLSQAYEKFPKLKELKEKGIDVDYIIDSENINTDNKEQEAWDEGTRKIADEHPVVSSALSVGSNLLSPLELAEDVNHAVKNLSSDKSYPINHASHPYSSYTNNVRQTVSEGIDNDIGKFVYNAGMSTVDSAADILVTKGFKGTKLAGGAASALMGANAANQSYMDTYERTGSAGQSLITGLGAGLAEWASEKFSLDSFEALKTTNPKQFRDFAKNLVKQGAVEGSEELASDFANAFVDRAVNGSKSEYNENVKNYIQQGMSKDEAKKNARKDFLIQVAEDTAAGAFSGGLFGTYANVYSKAQYESLVKKNGTSITEGNEGTDLLAYAAKRGMDTYEKAKDDTEKYGKISVDIMENAENNFTEARTSGELARAYEDAIRGVPDSLGVEIDQMAREKAQELAKKSKYAKFESERQALYDIMDASVSNAMKRTVSLNQKSEMMQKESVSKQEEDATANIDTTFDRVNLDEGMERNQRPVEVQELQPEKTKQNDAPSENVTNANFRQTENAAFTASDEQVKVKGFREIGKESATVETTDGEVVDLADLSFQDEGTQNLFNIASKMDNAAAATALVDYYNGKDNAGIYANNFRMAYRMGRLGSISFDKMMQASKSFRVMSDKGAMRLAYELGKVHGENAKAAEAEQKVAPVQRKGKGEYEDYRYSPEDEDSFVRVKKELAKKTGLDVLDLNTLTDKDADTVNGLLNMDRGQMAFAEDAENKFGVVIHESLEFASVMSENEYQKLMGVMLNYLVEKHGAEDIHALIESYQRAYEQVEGEKSYEDAAGELINDAVSGVFYDEAGAKNFIDWVMKDAKLDVNEKKNVFQKIVDLVKHVFEKIKSYIDDTPMTKAARLAAELDVEQKEKIQQMFMDAVDKAGEKYKKLDSNNRSKEKEVYSKYSVKVGMTEEERAKELRNESIMVQNKQMPLTQNERTNLNKVIPYKFEKLFKILHEKFELSGSYKNGEVEFNYSKIGTSESVHKSKQKYGKAVDNVQMLYHLRDIIENAVPIVIHDDIYKGTKREDPTIKNVYVMLGAYMDTKGIVPVEIIAKERDNGKNTIRMEVTLNKIGESVMVVDHGQNQLSTAQRSPISVSIPAIIKNVNTEYGDFLKYVPESLLTEEQIQVAKKAQEIQNKRVAHLKREQYYNHDLNTKKMNVSQGSSTSTHPYYKGSAHSSSSGISISNKLQNVNNVVEENKDIRYSISVDLDKQIDDVLNDTVPKDYTHVYLGETTKALKELGWNDLPMLMTNQHVYSVINEKKDKGARYKKIRNYHNLGKEKFMQVLEDIERPWMIIKSNNKENNADLVMVSSVVDKNGNVVIAAVKPNGVGRKKTATLDANIMLSMYGKESLHNYVEKASRENRIIKVNPDKAVGPTVQFRGNVLHQDYSNNLARYKEIVKNIISGEGEKYSLHVSERAEKLRHSLAETMTTEESLVEENKQLKKVVETLQSEFKPGKKTIPEPARVEAVCKKILKKYHSSFDAETFRDNLTKLYAYMNEEGADYKEALKITSEIARGVLEKSTAKDMTLYNEYKDLREYFRKTKLALSEAQKSEVNYMYGSMGEFRKSNFGRLRIVSEGTTLDQVWGELSEKYPELFKADTNDGDMIAEVMTVLDGLRPTYRNAYGEDIEQASYDLALNIYKEMSMIPQRQTFKDKADAAVEREWKEANRVYLAMLQDYRKECEKQFLEGLKVSMNDQIKNKNQRIREAYAKIHDYANVIETTQNGELIRKYQHEIEKQKRYIERLKKGQDKKIAEMKIENRQYRKNLSEQKKQTEAKNKIRRLHKQMRQMLMKPKEGMYVPQDLVRSVIDVCEAVNLGAKEGTQLYNALDDARQYFKKMKNDPDYNFASEYDEDIDYELQRIANRFKNNGNSIYDLSSADLDEVYDAMKMVYKTIRRATELIRKEGETNARKAAERVIHEVRSAKGVSSFMSTHKVLRKFPEFTLKSLNSYRAFRRITGYADGEFMQEWRELNEGQRKMLKIQQDGEAILADVMEDENVVKLMKTFDKKQGMVDTGLVYEDGKKVQVTKGMRMALVMHGMNKDNLRHMIYGGVTMPNMELYLKGDKKGAYDKTKKAVGVTSAKIQAMEDAMSPEEKKVLRAFKKLFHEYTGRVINETSMELYGFKKANEKNYYPISVDQNYVAADITGLKMDKTLEGAGFLKERVQSTKPLVLESIIDTAQRSLKITSEFGGLAIPIRNFNKVYNGSTWKVTDVDSEDVSTKSVLVQDDTVHKAMQDVWGRMASNYIDNLISDLQNARTGESTVFDMLRGNFAGSVLTGNWSVIMKQAASYPTAVATLGWEPVMKALAKGGKHGLPISSADRELIAKYTPLLWYRNKGNSTQEMADIDNLNSLTNRMPVVKEVKNMIQKVDVATVGRLWYASQYYVDANYKDLKKETDAYYRQVAEVFNRCVEDTQPNYTVMQRPDYLRDPSKIKKVMFMFMTQRMQNGGILYDAACNLHAKNQNGTKEQKKQARKEFAWAVSSQLVSAAVLSTMTFLARGLLHKVNPYRDDENELTTESVMSEWMNGVLGSLSGSFIGGNELYNLVYSAITKEKYYGIEVSLFSEISSLCESIVKMGNGVIDAFSDSDEEAENGKDAIKNAFFDAAGVVAKMCGIPVDNVKNVAVGIWKNVEDVTSGEGLFSFSTDKEEPKANVYGKKIYDALMDDDKKTAAQYREKMKQNGKKGEGDVETAVKDQLASRNDLVKQAAQYRLAKNHNGYMECYNKLIKMGFNHYEIVAATNSALNKMQDKTESGAKDAHDYLSFYKSDDLVAAIEEGKGYEEILQQMYEEAMTKIEKDDEKHELSASKKEKKAFASIRSKLSSEYKDKFRSAKNTHEKQLIMQKLYKLKIKGKCIYTSDTFKKWNEE